MMNMESGMGNSAALVISLQTGSTGGPSDDRCGGKLENLSESHIYIYIWSPNHLKRKHSMYHQRNDADLVAVRHGCSFTGVFQLSDNVTIPNCEALKSVSNN